MKSQEKAAPPSLVQKKIIPAKPSEVFEAWTNPRIMEQWFFPGTGSAVTTNDLRVGGRWTHEMIADAAAPGSGDETDDCGRYPHFGEYLEIKPPERLVFTWNSHTVKDTRVTIELRDLGGSTELTLTHELLPTDEARASHTQGWKGCLNNLEKHLAGK